jgi:rhamnogalacturonyl hydrolase YesR
LTFVAADKNGPSWEVIAQPGRDGNYFESFGTAVFIYGILKGIKKGYLHDRLLSGAKHVRQLGDR